MSGVMVATMIRSMSSASIPRRANSSWATAIAMVEVGSSSGRKRRSEMPVRERIHPSEVSTSRSRSALVTTLSGRKCAVAVMAARILFPSSVTQASAPSSLDFRLYVFAASIEAAARADAMGQGGLSAVGASSPRCCLDLPVSAPLVAAGARNSPLRYCSHGELLSRIFFGLGKIDLREGGPTRVRFSLLFGGGFGGSFNSAVWTPPIGVRGGYSHRQVQDYGLANVRPQIELARPRIDDLDKPVFSADASSSGVARRRCKSKRNRAVTPSCTSSRQR